MTIACQHITDAQEWNTLIRQLPRAHFLQTWEWGEFKAQSTGWNAERCLYRDTSENIIAAASILARRMGPFRVMYVPKGPLFADEESTYMGAVLEHLEGLARRRLAIWLKIDPDIEAGRGIPDAAPVDDDDRPDRENPYGQRCINILQAHNWRFSDDQIQFRNTFYTDLTQSEDELMSDMSSSTRRKIRIADREGVEVRATTDDNDLRTLFDIYALTSDRQDFTIRPWEYYHQLWRSFLDNDLARVLVAEVDGEIVSGMVLFHFGQRVWYFNGMSSNKHRDKQPNHALQWAAMQWAKSAGYTIYDWWGAPDTFTKDDPMWGVYQFKDRFGGEVVRHIGAWDYVPYPPLNYIYRTVMPRVMRWLGRSGNQDD